MTMFGFGTAELAVVALILVLLFGASRIPAIGSGVGKGIRNFLDSVRDKRPEAAEEALPEKTGGGEA